MIWAYLLFSIFLTAFYAILIWNYFTIWKSMPLWKIPENYIPKTKVSILIPARNEVENIERCLKSIFKQNCPKELFEIIVLDDFSEDRTGEVVTRIANTHENILYLKLADFITENDTQSFKKKAIEIGVAHASGDLIITTDADVEVSEHWLNLIISFYENKAAEFIAAPVNFYHENTLLEKFQSLDFMGMMCVTGAGIHSNLQKMCNGANLAYSRKAFSAVNGFEGIETLASGDDMFLMQKISKEFPNKIGFLKNAEATVFTKAKPNLKSFIAQRIRWATKNGSANGDWKVTAILAMVFFYCCNILLSFLMIPFWNFWALSIFLLQLSMKMLADYFFLNQMAIFFNRRDLMKYFLSAQILHIIYITGIGFWANMKKQYIWKGRRVR